MKVKLISEPGDNRDVLAGIAIKLLNSGRNHTRVRQVSFKHNGKKYKFKSSNGLEVYLKKYPELNLGEN